MLVEITPEMQQFMVNILNQTSIALPPPIQNRSEMNIMEMQTIGQTEEVQKIQAVVTQLQRPVPADIETEVKKIVEARSKTEPIKKEV